MNPTIIQCRKYIVKKESWPTRSKVLSGEIFISSLIEHAQVRLCRCQHSNILLLQCLVLPAVSKKSLPITLLGRQEQKIICDCVCLVYLLASHGLLLHVSVCSVSTRDFENSSEIVIVILDHKPTLLAGNMESTTQN